MFVAATGRIKSEMILIQLFLNGKLSLFSSFIGTDREC